MTGEDYMERKKYPLIALSNMEDLEGLSYFDPISIQNTLSIAKEKDADIINRSGTDVEYDNLTSYNATVTCEGYIDSREDIKGWGTIVLEDLYLGYQPGVTRSVHEVALFLTLPCGGGHAQIIEHDPLELQVHFD